MKYLERVLISLSILFNVLLGGKSNQTFSARNYYWKKWGYFNLVFIIDLIFFWQQNHCQKSYEFWLELKGKSRNLWRKDV